MKKLLLNPVTNILLDALFFLVSFAYRIIFIGIGAILIYIASQFVGNLDGSVAELGGRSIDVLMVCMMIILGFVVGGFVILKAFISSNDDLLELPL